jgi:uncharacterized membrane protein YeiB
MTGGGDPLNAFATWFFVSARFRAIFGMLFGIGVALQMQRASEKGNPFLGFFTRRMVILAAFGMLNFLFYRGDILTRYALVGMVLVPFYRLPVRRIFIAAILVLLAHALMPLAVQSEAGERAWVVAVRETLSLLPPTDQTCQTLRYSMVGNYYTAGSFWQVRMVEACRFRRKLPVGSSAICFRPSCSSLWVWGSERHVFSLESRNFGQELSAGAWPQPPLGSP